MAFQYFKVPLFDCHYHDCTHASKMGSKGVLCKVTCKKPENDRPKLHCISWGGRWWLASSNFGQYAHKKQSNRVLYENLPIPNKPINQKITFRSLGKLNSSIPGLGLKGSNWFGPICLSWKTLRTSSHLFGLPNINPKQHASGKK